MPPWFVYILECHDGTLYTGMTNDLDSRLKKHRSGTGSKYTKGHGAEKIVHFETLRTKPEALRREHEIKKLTRKKKLLLISNTSFFPFPLNPSPDR